MDSLQENIKATARKLFFRYGLRSVSISDICDHLRISKKTFYTFFNQKEQLIDQLLTERDNDMSRRWLNNWTSIQIPEQPCPAPSEPAFDEEPWHSCRESILARFIEMPQQATPKHNEQFMRDAWKYHSDIMEKHNSALYASFGIGTKVCLQKGKQCGLFRSDIDEEIEAPLLLAWIFGAHLFIGKEMSKEVQAESRIHLIRMVMRSLCTPESLPQAERALQRASAEKSEKTGKRKGAKSAAERTTPPAVNSPNITNQAEGPRPEAEIPKKPTDDVTK